MKTQSQTSVSAHVASPLSRGQRERMRLALEAKRRQLLSSQEARADEAASVEVEAGDVADVAESVIDDRLRAALNAHDRALLEDIDHALAKFDQGTFGIGEATGLSIPFERLLAVPWARNDSGEAERIEHESRG